MNVEKIMADLDSGARCVVMRDSTQQWQVDQEAKEAILTFFKNRKVEPISEDPPFFYADKIPVKTKFPENVRIVPPAVVRYGAFVASGAVLMPSYINIGAYVSSGTLIDNFALVGSCAYVGKNCHISAHVTLGGVLEPVQARPVIIEDDCFVGAGARIVEGVLIRTGAVIGAGVTLTGSTRIVDVRGKEEVVLRGEVPAKAVVIPGTYTKKFSGGEFGVGCALIIGERTESHDSKLSLNETLRKFNEYSL